MEKKNGRENEGKVIVKRKEERFRNFFLIVYTFRTDPRGPRDMWLWFVSI